MQGGLPGGSSLDVPPFAEVTRYGVSQQRDVVKFSTRRRENEINSLLLTGKMLGNTRSRAGIKKERVNQHHGSALLDYFLLAVSHTKYSVQPTETHLAHHVSHAKQ